MRRRSIEDIERDLRTAGHDVEREYVMDGLDTYDGDGWVVRVDGALGRDRGLAR